MNTVDSKKRNQFVETLDTWLRDRFRYRSQLTDIGMSPNTITVRRAKVQLYLRFLPLSFNDKPWPQRTLVIASIEFKDQHKGHGRALLRFFVDQAERFGYDKIGVECTGPQIGIQSFCAKFFFDVPTSERRNYNWIASVDHIAKVLNEQ
jgi:hypothetical protein